MAGASPAGGDQTLIVIDNHFERRYFYSATTATRGLGWIVWANNLMVRRGQVKAGEVKVYRLDEEASINLASALTGVPQNSDANGNWTKSTKENFMNLFEVYAGIRRT